MKCIALISLIFLLTSAASRDLKRFAREAEHKSEIARRFNNLKEETFEAIALITFAQYLQKCSYESLNKLVKVVVDLAHTCVANMDAPGCTKSVPAIFLDEICQIETLHDSYGAMADCCAKADPERNQCFLSFRTTNPSFIKPYEKPEPEAVCREFREDKQSFLGHYIYRAARRFPFVYAPTILALSIDYEHAVETCCARTDIGACLDEKVTALKDRTRQVYKIHRYNCRVLKTFGERSFQADTLALISQKYPKAPFAEIYKTAKDISDEHKECCDGDMVECMDDRAQIVEHICSNQEAFSSTIRECCKKPLVEKCQCVVEAEFDDKPADLPPIAEKYMQDPDVCKHFEEGHNKFMGEFLYDYSRRHQEFSTPMLLRLAKKYEDLLEKCCKTENSSQCYGKAEEEFQNHIQETENLIKANCDLLKQGEFEFLQVVLTRYTKKMPQVPTETLLEVAKKMILVGVKCCQEPENRRMPCGEGYLDMVFQEMCETQKTIPVNDQVAHCCSASYANRIPCFTKLGVDENYVPPPLNPDMFDFGENLCSDPLATQQENQLKLLVNLIKRKPTMTDEQLKKIIAGFKEMVDKCCKKEDHDTCFGEEGGNLIVESRAILGIGV
ncbi:serum albumin-like [Alligator sinensis]|uniref:Serum albumin-like n=1 Tax=Alligator sinensis TaxID=38654 RepID=A0A1U7RTP4_ALLSI|nr:serum albumin-like [Alligator sinensis]